MAEKIEIRGVGRPSDNLMTISNPEGERFLVFDKEIYPHLELGKIVELDIKRDVPKKSGDGTYNLVNSITVDGNVIGGKQRKYTPSRGRDEDRTDIRSALITIKDLWLGGKLKDDNPLVTWLLAELLVIASGKRRVKGETTKTTKNDKTDNQPQDEGEGAGQDSNEGDESERVQGFLKYLEKHDISKPRLFLAVEYHIPQDEKLTPKKCEALYQTIRKDKKW